MYLTMPYVIWVILACSSRGSIHVLFSPSFRLPSRREREGEPKRPRHPVGLTSSLSERQSKSANGIKGVSIRRSLVPQSPSTERSMGGPTNFLLDRDTESGRDVRLVWGLHHAVISFPYQLVDVGSRWRKRLVPKHQERCTLRGPRN